MQRIAIIGTTGSGKTTLAERVAIYLGCSHIELDSLFWLANWKPVPDEEFRTRVARAITAERWVSDGNYISKVRALIWERADTIVWLDYPLLTVLWRLFKRTVRRSVSQERLWNNNRETLHDQFLTRESLFLWAVKTHPIHRAQYPKLFSDVARSDQTVVILCNQWQTDAWISSLKRQTPE